nr:MAG TPA: Head Tail Connector Protein [Caudoviricetes sp.]
MNLLVSLDDAREFLRMDGQEDDGVIASLLAAAETLCLDVLRLKGAEVPETALPVLRTGILYATAYLYEHREEADHARLLLTLRALLAGERKEEF